MPLIKGKSRDSFRKNVSSEYDEGKPLKQSLAIAYAMKRKAEKKAHGGMIREEEESGYEDMPEEHPRMNEMAEDEDEDMIERIMKKRMMSKGGMVANEDHGPDDDRLADFSPNEFDDLSLRDDLEHHYTGANSGDEIGDEQEDHDRHDIVSKIMKSRKLKDKMPIAGYGSSYGRYK